MVKIRTTIILLLLTALTTQSQTYITGGEATGSWTPDGSPYIIEGDLIVAPEERLEIEAGVEVLFTGPYVIEVYGRLEAIGTPNDSIYFGMVDTTGFVTGNYNGWLGIGLIGYSAITSENSRFEYCNIAYSAGSGITCVHYPNFELNHSRISNNKAYGLLLTDFSDITATDILIEHNGTGGIQVNFSAPAISNFEIANNNGTGISIYGNSSNSIFELISGTIHHNLSTENGGGIATYEEAMMNISQVGITNNIAFKGAGIYANSGLINLNDAVISFNQAQQGGGVYLENNCSLAMEFITISHNNAQSTGGGVFNESANIQVTQSTIADNQAISGGGFYFELYDQGNNVINSSIIWNNTSESIAVANIAPVVQYSDIDGGFEGLGNIDQDPLFAQSDNNDYHLTWANFPVENELTSPCIDAGDASLPFDPDGTIADMGAYYFHQDMFVTQVNENKPVNQIDIYPNPANSEFFINSNDEIEMVEITNLSGQVVKKIEGINTYSKVDISDLQAAIYLVVFRDNAGNANIKKLIKQ